MTDKEALDRITYNLLESEGQNDDFTLVSTSTLRRVIQMAQMSSIKTTNQVGLPVKKTQAWHYVYNCPKCNEEIKVLGAYYCTRCGTKLDWSKE